MTNKLWAYIESERLTPGDRLMAERDLAAHLSLPRTALRRMLAELEGAGMIVREIGRGTFIAGSAGPPRLGGRRQGPPAQSLDWLANTNPTEVFETRLTIEPQLAHMAAQRATPEHMREMSEAIERGRRAQSLGEFEHWDSKFHSVVAKAARNELMLAVYELISSVRAGNLWGKLKEQSLTPQRMEGYVADHEVITTAIRDRDHQRAEEAMTSHIFKARNNMFNLD
ncbi:FadR/GntR family transcriptional regulator [Bosea sp. (in: a-proteobacteria)]|uniref:FadR/GntR family transcriptional regulator n=1 Tax=Bosea sp. (in: a-proteobacteria) TaxID=1871050 RepID=UPI002628FE9A|nr:FCD domain-containing protein [Bosea sp. (in: a-proteobacteria)]MCO5092938.1 FCD domain-containing protein [Bosea sp. (in: a-proteobacteria)]